MSTTALVGIATSILAVIAAYWFGYSSGFAAGRGHGYDEGKKDGSKEGSMRGYAVGYDRGRHGREEGSGAQRPQLGLGMIGLVLAGGAILYLAASSRHTSLRSNSPPTPTEPQITVETSEPRQTWPAADPPMSKQPQVSRGTWPNEQER